MESKPTISAIVCGKDDFHPYECAPEEGEPPCIHCEGTRTDRHDPEKCALCKGEGFDDI